jgi:hypothetical protein
MPRFRIPTHDPAPRPAVTPGLRRLWRIGGSLAAVGALVIGTGQVAGALAHDEETVRTVFAAADITRVEVFDDAGHVRVVGTDTDAIEVVAHVSHGLPDTRHSERVVDGVLEVRARCPEPFAVWCGVDYTIEVPTDTDVTLRGESGLDVSDVAGDVDIDSDNGRVTATRLSGDLRLRSDNGRVVGTALASTGVEAEADNGRVSLSFAESPRSVSARSQNGSVEVVVPDDADVAYRVDADTDNGSVSTLVDTDRDSDRTITALSDNGSVTVRYR